MSHQPPIPEASQSPYLLHPAPIVHDTAALPPVAALTAAHEISLPANSTLLGIGAAIGVGAAALAGLAYARRNRAGVGGGDDKAKRGGADRSRIAASQPYEVQYFARKHKISAAVARSIIKEAGPDRAAANSLAQRRKR